MKNYYEAKSRERERKKIMVANSSGVSCKYMNR